MPSLNNVVLAVTTEKPDDEITMAVNCDVAFSDTDLHAMRELGQRYTLSCEVFRKEMLEEIPVLAYGDQKFPSVVGDLTRDEHVTFQLRLPLNALHGRWLGRDDLTARVRLVDSDTGWEIVQDSEHVSIDLAA